MGRFCTPRLTSYQTMHWRGVTGGDMFGMGRAFLRENGLGRARLGALALGEITAHTEDHGSFSRVPGDISVLTPQRLFESAERSAAFLDQAPFLDRARREREEGRDSASKVALGAYLVARLVTQIQEKAGTDEERESFRWQEDSTRRFLADLPQDQAEVAHLQGIVDALSGKGGLSGLRLSLTAYAYYLEHEGRFEEALQVLANAGRTYGGAIPVAESASLALFVGRLNRVLTRWSAANNAYLAAEEAGLDAGDQSAVLLSRLGRANVLRGQGNLPRARAAIEEIVAQAKTPELTEVRGRAYMDLGVVLLVQGQMVESLQAYFQALELTQDSVTQCRILGDMGIIFRDLGVYAAARQAFEIVTESQVSFLIKANAFLELMDLESAAGNRVAFERRRQDASEYTRRMPPSMGVDFRFKLGVGLARFDQLGRARQVLREALDLADQHRLNEWSFRIDGVLGNLDTCPDIPPLTPTMVEAWETPAIAEVASGLQRYTSLAAD